MRRGGGRSKGHGFERKVVTILGKWAGRPFKRVPQSGGWDKTIISGDIFCVDEYSPKDASRRVWLPLSLECKCAESWEFVHFFKEANKSSLRQWWKQASDDAQVSKKIPTLIFTRNWLPNFIMLHTRALNRLAKLVGPSWKKYSHINFQISKSDHVTVLLLDDFLEWVDFATLLNLTV